MNLLLLIAVVVNLAIASGPAEHNQLSPKFTATDAAVVEALLVDLLNDKSFCCSYLEPKQEEAQIVLDTKVHPSDAFGLVGFLPAKKNYKVDGFVDQKETVPIPEDICRDLERRNRRREFGITYKPVDPRIISGFHRKSAHKKPLNGFYFTLEDTYPKAKASVSIALPGYSADGSTCVIRFRVEPTPHGSEGTAMLKRVEGRWKVISRVIHYYV